MARSFYRPTVANVVEDYSERNTYYHKPSNRYFAMVQREGKFYQRRYQLDSTGRQINVLEKRADFILGSGNHARTYLNRTERNTLVEMPLGWYAEKGGYWAMNPGYDRPDHDGFRRPISYDCMFCHNANPRIPAGHEQPFAEPVYQEPLPEGIDCQRCHGPGARHVQLATGAGAKVEEIRKAVINPARLSAERQMEVCMVCHLETTSFPLPNGIVRYGRGPFSYVPGEAMGDFILSFDHAPGTGHEDKFEIVNAAYRLRRSACFLKSNGKLLCTTCHNPHDIPHGEEAARHYNAVCRGCHAGAFAKEIAAGRHTGAGDCIDCHMPKRRTEDVVHAAATDHLIQRRKPAGDLLAEMAERHEIGDQAYRGPVVLYYPESLPHTAENELYLAVAQVNQQSNLAEGIRQLTAAIEKYTPKRAEFYYELGEAWRDSGEMGKAIPAYRQAIERNPKLVVAYQKMGFAQRTSGQFGEAAETLKRATAIAQDRAPVWLELGLTYRAQGKGLDATAAFEKAVQLDPDMAEAQNNIGISRIAAGDQARGEWAFREAIRLRPDFADAHGNLGNLLAVKGDLAGAISEFETALRSKPEDGGMRYGYAVALGRAGRYDEAQRELEGALRSDPGLADAHELLGDMLMAKGQAQAAVPHYRDAVRIRPGFDRAHLGLGAALATTGDVSGAVVELEKAAGGADPEVRAEAMQLLRQLGRSR